MISLLLMNKIFHLFLIMLLGYLIVKVKILKAGESVVLSQISLYLIMPCVILNAFQVNFNKNVQQGLLLALVATVLIHILLIGFGYLAGKLFNFDEVDIASTVYSNSGNLIIPIVVSILGSEWVIYSSAFISVQLIFLWTHGKLLFSKEKKLDLRNIILNVNIIAILLSILLMLTGIKFPVFINEAIDSVSNMIGPISMLITGMVLAGMDLKKIFSNMQVYKISFLRMILLPAIILILIKFSNADQLVNYGTEILLITFLATAAPAASAVTQFAQIYKKDAEYAGAINIMTTVACIVTMPIFVFLYYL